MASEPRMESSVTVKKGQLDFSAPSTTSSRTYIVVSIFHQKGNPLPCKVGASGLLSQAIGCIGDIAQETTILEVSP